MALLRRIFGSAQGMISAVGALILLMVGFFSILFTSSKMHRFSASSDANVAGVAHADTPASGDSGCSGGDSGSSGGGGSGK